MKMISILSLARNKQVYPTMVDIEEISKDIKDLFFFSLRPELILPGSGEFEKSILDIYEAITARNHVALYPEMEDIISEIDFINLNVIETYSKERGLNKLWLETLLAVESEFLINYIDDILYKYKKIYYQNSLLIYPQPRFKIKERFEDEEFAL